MTEPLKTWRPRTWIVTPKGRIGMVHHTSRKRRRVLLQLGADGPFMWMKPTELRRATDEEIEYINGARRPHR